MPISSPTWTCRQFFSLAAVALGSISLAACDPVYTTKIDAVIPVDVQQAFSPEAPGVVIVDSTLVARLCSPTSEPIVSHTSVAQVGCGTERPIHGLALFVSQLDASRVDASSRRFLTCGDTSALEVENFAPLGGPDSAVVPKSVTPIAAGDGLAFKGQSCDARDGETITLELQLR